MDNWSPKTGVWKTVTVVGIHQPNYFPWVGYFHKIASVDKFIFLDDIQYSKGSYTNRVQYLSNDKVHWLTVPCKPTFGTKINKVRIPSDGWQEQHLNKIKSAYRKCPMFNEVWPNVENWLGIEVNGNLSDLNIHIIKEICDYLDIKTKFYRSSDFCIGQELNASSRLVELTKILGGHEYFSGLGAKKYQEEKLFFEQNLSIKYLSFVEKPREQGTACFQRGLSILDLVLNIDAVEAKNIILARG